MVGYTLRQERERQNLSISDIEQGTSIRALYIEAIENGEYDKLPGKVYTKGFVKNYAKFLELDVDSVVKEFAADMNEIETVEAPPPVEEKPKAPEKPAEVKPAKVERKPLGHSVQQEESTRPPIKIIAAAVVLLAVVVGGAWSFLSGSDNEVAQVNPPVQQEQPAVPEPPPPPENPTPVAQATPAPKTDGVAVQARFNDRCWALVTVDGAVVQEGVIEGGQTMSWEGKENITFRLGNAGAVEFFQDGKSIGILGGIGDVVDKTFTRS